MSSFSKSPYMKRYIFKHIEHYYWQLKYACQRFVKGYDSLDRIGIDMWFSMTLEDILKDWEKDTWGYPQGCTFDGVKINTFEDWQAVILDFYETVKMYNELEYGSRFDRLDIPIEEYGEYLKNRTIEDINAEEDLIRRYETEMLRKFAMLYGRLWI
jgi:hypothetical protein